MYPLNQDCYKGEVKPVVHGSFYFAGRGETSVTISDFLSGSADSESQVGVRGEHMRRLRESWQRLQPVVECGDDSMTLTVRRRQAMQLLLGPVNGPSFAQSQLPPQCGYSIHRSWRDLSIEVQYDGCHVTQEGDSYALPLLWKKIPIKMSCPVSPVQSQALDVLSLCCSPYGITVRIQNPSVTKELNINVRGAWTPLELLAQDCGYTLDRRDTEIVFTAPFLACGITSKDGKYTLSLQIEEETFMLACLLSPAGGFQQSNHLTTTTTKPLPEAIEPFSWAPPFYLAPPHYPHPTPYHKYPRAHLQDATASLLPATTTFESMLLTPLQPQQDEQNDHMQRVHADEYYIMQASSEQLKDSTKVFPNLQQKQETTSYGAIHSPTSATGFTAFLQPHNYNFNPFHHYYHHPKIPLTNRPPKAPDPNLVVNPSEVSLVKSQSSVIPPLGSVDAPQLSQPSLNLYPNPELYPELYAPQLYPYYASHITAKTNLGDGQNQEVRKFKNNKNAYMYYSSPHETPVLERDPQQPLWSENEDAKLDNIKESAPVTPVVKLPLSHSPREQHSIHAQAKHNTPLYHYLPYYHYWIYHGPKGLQNENPPPTFTEAVTPSPPQHTASPTPQSMLHVPETGLGNPHFYYYRPKEDTRHQPAQPSEGLNPEDEPTAYSGLLFHDGSWEEWFNPGTEAEYAPEFLYNPHYMSQLQLHDPVERPEAKADDEMQDHINSNVHTPFAAPCGSGIVSDFLCTFSPGCPTFAVKDCTLGEYFVFSLPGFVVAPKVAISAHLSEPCAVQRLTSNPLLYFVPLNGCGVTKQMVESFVVYQLELQAVLLHKAHDSGYSLRMMVECSVAPGLLGAMTLHILNPPPAVQYTEAAPVPVQLRIATDESFSRFYPEAHLPLSSIQGRPLYLELSPLRPPAPSVVLLVHYCLAYTLTPHVTWMLIYDSCPSWSDSHLLPSPFSNDRYIVRVIVSSSLSLLSLNPSHMAEGGPKHVEDPEVYFFCFTEVCSAADGVCAVGCINSPKREL